MNTSTSKAEEKDPIVSALVSVGVLMIPAGFLRWYFYHDFVGFGWRDWVFVLGAPVYFALGVGVRCGSQRAGQLIFALGLAFQLFCLSGTLSERSLSPWRDGSLLLWVSFCPLLWAGWASSERWAASAGVPPIVLKDGIKMGVCSFGIAVPLVTLFTTFLMLKMNAEMFPKGSSEEIVHDQSQFALWSAVVSAISASILTCSLMTARPLMMERRRQFKAARQAAEKSGQE